MAVIRFLFTISSLLLACHPTTTPVPLPQRFALPGQYEVIVLRESPYTDTNVDDVVLYDTTSLDAVRSPITLTFSQSDSLSTLSIPSNSPYMPYFDEAGLINLHHWTLSDNSLVITSDFGQSTVYTVELADHLVTLTWVGEYNDPISIDQLTVTYSLFLRKR